MSDKLQPTPDQEQSAMATLEPAGEGSPNRAKPGRHKHVVQRETFETSRGMEFCSEKELTRQIGYGPKDWPLVIFKELVDNSLDGCEEAEVPPKITVQANESGISVSDNGPGIPAETVKGVCDFQIRVSSREAYRAPDRGAQGYGLKTLIAMPLALGGSTAPSVIEAQGVRHSIGFEFDAIAQEPVVTCAPEACSVTNGTSVTIPWPDAASSHLTRARDRVLQYAYNYTYLNPHLHMTVRWFDDKPLVYTPTNPNWQKWNASRPTSAHWYTQNEFERLIAAQISRDRHRNTDRSVREFVSQFHGLSATTKQRAVLDATGLVRVPLSELTDGSDFDHERTAALLKAMKELSKPVKPAALGIIGKDHFATKFERLKCRMESFTYWKKSIAGDDGLPCFFEMAFVWRGGEAKGRRRLIIGTNWSVAIGDPFRTLGEQYQDSLAALLERQRAGADEPVVIVVHFASPHVQYTDRGKSTVSL